MTLEFSVQEKLVGALVLLVLVVSLAVLGMISQGKNWFRPHHSYYVTFDDGYNLAVGSKVRLLGHDIGEVRGVVLTEDNRVRIRLRVLADQAGRIRADSWATVRAAILVGGEYVAIAPGSPWARPIAPGGEIPARRPHLLADLLEQSASNIDFRRLGQAIDHLAALANRLGDPQGELFKTLADARGVMAEVRQLLASLRRGEGTVGRLLTSDQLYRAAQAQMAKLDGVMGRLQKIMDRASAKSLAKVEVILERLEKATGLLNQAMGQAPTLARQAGEVLAKLNQILGALKANFLIRPNLPQTPAPQSHGSEIRGE